MTSEDLTVAALLELGSATLGESGGSPMRARVRAAWPGARLAARAFPVRCTPGDNLAIHVGVAEAPGGAAIVADVGDEPERGYWGEVLTVAAQARGLVGLVIDGGVRDVAEVAGHGFPVFSTTIALPGATKQGPGAVGGAVTVGGVEVGPGDWVVGDTDGVTVVPADRLREVLDAGRARADREVQLFADLRSGSTTIERLGLDTSSIARD